MPFENTSDVKFFLGAMIHAWAGCLEHVWLGNGVIMHDFTKWFRGWLGIQHAETPGWRFPTQSVRRTDKHVSLQVK
jgi:hypothetical protein